MGGPLSGIYPFLLHFLVDLVQLCRFDTSNFYFRAILTEKKTIFVLLVVCLAATKTVGRNVCQVAKLIQVASSIAKPILIRKPLISRLRTYSVPELKIYILNVINQKPIFFMIKPCPKSQNLSSSQKIFIFVHFKQYIL